MSSVLLSTTTAEPLSAGFIIMSVQSFRLLRAIRSSDGRLFLHLYHSSYFTISSFDHQVPSVYPSCFETTAGVFPLPPLIAFHCPRKLRDLWFEQLWLPPYMSRLTTVHAGLPCAKLVLYWWQWMSFPVTRLEIGLSWKLKPPTSLPTLFILLHAGCSASNMWVRMDNNYTAGYTAIDLTLFMGGLMNLLWQFALDSKHFGRGDRPNMKPSPMSVKSMRKPMDQNPGDLLFFWKEPQGRLPWEACLSNISGPLWTYEPLYYIMVT